MAKFHSRVITLSRERIPEAFDGGRESLIGIEYRFSSSDVIHFDASVKFKDSCDFDKQANEEARVTKAFTMSWEYDYCS